MVEFEIVCSELHCPCVTFWQYMSPGQQDLPAELFTKKGLWALSHLRDESGCVADMASITWFSTCALSFSVQKVVMQARLLSSFVEFCGTKLAQGFDAGSCTPTPGFS